MSPIFKRNKKRNQLNMSCKSAELTVDFMKELFDGCNDVQFYNIENQTGVYTAIMCEGLYDREQLFNKILYPLEERMDGNDVNAKLQKLSAAKSVQLQEDVSAEHIVASVFTGKVIVLHEQSQSFWEIDIIKHPKRQVEEPSTEVSIRGSKEGFIEEASMNMALIRKRLRTTTLKVITYEIGERTKTRVMLMYIEDITNLEVIEEAKSRLEKLKVDGIVSNVRLEELIGDRKRPLFPLFSYTGRPDFVVDSLLHGRFAILVDGTPTALIAPVNLLFVLKTAEDANMTSIFVGFERLIRYVGFYLALFLPSFWIAIISYHPDQLPFTLLATVTLSREGVPLPAALECFLMLALFELFREAGVRLPMVIGQILSVVGGIIIGQAAIAAGFTAPGILVVNAIALVSTFTLINQSLTGLVGILRLVILLFTSFLGMYGFFLSLFAVIGYLANLRSFGVPYLAPISPMRPREISKAIWNPGDSTEKRPSMLKTSDSSRKERNE
ncbi:spore germination protein [Pontibacillus sp. HMF3514]|uniref:spore germination protein n=1 Tax=Pontibacillus sp. HMF3514 TaxID=2692425 RepID=UPI00131FA469|nr:spore germination protein [Pontibacillus sp. HMF3514]QHE51182.1 spore germination protein [Pontibacillus sp. HMF3514]